MSEAIEIQFDAFCKKVIKHACLDAHAQLRRRAECEQPLELAYDIPAQTDMTTYVCTWLHTDKLSICIHDPELVRRSAHLCPDNEISLCSVIL